MTEPFDRRMMRRALDLAGRARGFTAPNPMVGAVVTRGGVIVGEGYHRRAGKPHAEVEALRRADGRARGGELFVTLEPCSHFGRTPPCAEKIIKAGLDRVVIAMRDPNPLVRGRGINMLRRAGLAVEVGLLGSEARRLNEIYVHHITTGRPFVALKLAQTLDGAIASAPATRTGITSRASLKRVHLLRARYDAVLVGITTVLADDPLLNVRGIGRARQPARIVLDPCLDIPPRSRLVESAADSPVVVVCDPSKAPPGKPGELAVRGVQVLSLGTGEDSLFDIGELLGLLAGEHFTSILVEGGRQVATSFLAAGMVQRLHLFIAPTLMGEGGPVHAVGEIGAAEKPLRLGEAERDFCGPDLYITGRLDRP